jgi:thioredoxin reductase (NADPH)
LIEKGSLGGKLLNIKRVENYPGIIGKSCYEIANNFIEQSKNYGTNFLNINVKKIENLNEKLKKVILENGKTLQTKALIIASGTKPLKLDVDGYDEYYGKGISSCLICDGAFFKNKTIAVVGGGKSATQESLNNSSLFKKIYIINQYDKFRAEKINLDKLKKNSKFKLLTNTKITKIKGDGKKVNGIEIFDSKQKINKTLKVDAVFSYIG